MLEERLGPVLKVVPSFYGMHIAALARMKFDCEAVSHALSRRGVLIHSLDRYFVGSSAQTGFVIAYAAADKKELRVAVDALAEEISTAIKFAA